MTDISSSLNSLSTSSTSDRPSGYLSILNSILSQPRSSLSSNSLIDSISTYLDIAAFSDLNSAGGGLVVARKVLDDFVVAIQNAIKTKTTTSQEDVEMKVDGDGHGDQDEGDHVPAIRDLETTIKVFQNAIDKTSSKVLSFEEQATSLRLALADILETSEDWTAAANVLSGISLESSHRSVTPLQKLRIYVRIARLHLESSDPVSADMYLKRASMLLHSVPGAITKSAIQTMADLESGRNVKASQEDLDEAGLLGLQYKLSQARVYDSQKKFQEASLRFHELSYLSSVDESEREMMLSASVTCAILAPAGPHRSRILSTLIRDDRTATLPQHTILLKVFLEQIIRPSEISSFEELLAPHQRALLPPSSNEKALEESIRREEERVRDEEEKKRKEPGGGDEEMNGVEESNSNGNGAGGVEGSGTGPKLSTRSGPTTVLDRSMMEHNLLAASNIYKNITLKGLGILLDLSKGGSEALARRMISQGRLKAEIDQVDEVVSFFENISSNEIGGQDALAMEKDEINQDGPNGEIPDEELPDPGSENIKLWDEKIARTAHRLEDVCQRLTKEGLLPLEMGVGVGNA